MNCHIERDWITMGHRVTLYEREAGALRVLYFDHGQHHWVRKPANELFEPTFRLPPEALEAFLNEAQTVVPVTVATQAHLNDAMAVRDRLLSLVEEGWTS